MDFIRKWLAWALIAVVLGAPVLAWSQDTDEGPEQGPITNAVVSKEDRASAYDEIELLTEAILLIKKHYVQEKTYKDITYGALNGMLRALDEHSSFLEPAAYSEMQEETAGKFSGIGIHIGMRDGMLTVIAPIEDTPAFRAGVQAGDRIVEIDGVKTVGLSLRDAVNRLRGPKGQKVTILMYRPSTGTNQPMEIVRDDITVPSVKGARIIRDGVGYVRVTQFATPTADSLQAALEKLAGEGMNALVLDLRSNPGGLLKSAVDVAQKFLKRGQLIVTTRGRKGVMDEVKCEAFGDRHYTDFPMAILVDGGTASASEIVSGALQDHKRAVLVGETTFGKGSVQSVIQMKADGKSAMRLTTALYYTPNGRQIHNKGLEPDIPVQLSAEEWRKVQIRRAHVENPDLFSDEDKKPYADVVDRQLERAVDLLQAVKVFQK